MSRKMKRLLSIFLAAFTATALLSLTACGEKDAGTTSGGDGERRHSENNTDGNGGADENNGGASGGVGNVGGDVKLEKGDTYAVMKIRDFGDITLKLFPECAPIAVQNFIDLANSGYYDGKLFHRIMKDFMIQGGSPNGDGMSDPGYDKYFSIEPNENAVNAYGALSMANAGPDKNSQQFFIVNATEGAHFLDGQYTVFGQTVEGFDVLDEVSAVKVEMSDSGEKSKPVKEVVLDTVTINTYEG